MDRANRRGSIQIWAALLLAAGAVALGAACGTPVEPEGGGSSGRSPANTVACEGDAGDCDGGTDAGRDGGRDSGVDAGHDAGPDSGVDAGHDAGPDSGVDAGPDAGPDGGHDGGCDPMAMEAAALRGEAVDAVDPAACKWNIPPDTRNAVPINKIYDVGPANLIIKSQELQTTDYEICSADSKKSSSGSIQGCWRYAANLMGACVSGSGSHSNEDGTCQTPFCPCEGADGECREPSCALHKDNAQYGAGGGINLGLYQSKNIPLIGRIIPWSQGFNINANVIAQLGYGWGNDDRDGSGACFNCCPNGNPKRDDVQHGNAEIKGTVFVTARVWNLCATLSANAAACYQHDFINRLDCDGAKQFLNEDRGFFYFSFGNFYVGACLGEKDKKAQARGGICNYDAATETAQCGWGWFSYAVHVPNYVSKSVNGGNATMCLF
jgi:hypothetical protein